MVVQWLGISLSVWAGDMGSIPGLEKIPRATGN